MLTDIHQHIASTSATRGILEAIAGSSAAATSCRDRGYLWVAEFMDREAEFWAVRLLLVLSQQPLGRIPGYPGMPNSPEARTGRVRSKSPNWIELSTKKSMLIE